MNKTKPNIFEYIDVHAYLKDYYKWKKDNDEKYSYGVFAFKAGLKKIIVYQVIRNNRNLRKKSDFVAFSKALDHNPKEAEYFETIALLTKAQNALRPNLKEIEFLGNKASEIKNSVLTPSYLLNEEQLEYVSQWYHPAIRSFIGLQPFYGDCLQLSRKLSPPIDETQVKESIELLECLGLITKDTDGAYRTTEKKIEVIGKAKQRFFTQNSDLATRSISGHSSEIRNICSSTLGISADTYKIIRDEIMQLSQKILNLACNDNKADRIYQFHSTFFPLIKD